jgi:predicted transcriptional regulator
MAQTPGGAGRTRSPSLQSNLLLCVEQSYLWIVVTVVSSHSHLRVGLFARMDVLKAMQFQVGLSQLCRLGSERRCSRTQGRVGLSHHKQHVVPVRNEPATSTRNVLVPTLLVRFFDCTRLSVRKQNDLLLEVQNLTVNTVKWTKVVVHYRFEGLSM